MAQSASALRASSDDPRWSRVLLKLSGEAFAGGDPLGIDPTTVAAIARQIVDVVSSGVQVAVVVGGGNMFRGQALAEQGITAGVVVLTSPDLVFRSFQARGSLDGGAGGILDQLFPAHAPAPIVTVQDGHPHTLAFLAGARGDRIRCLGVTEFGQSTSVEDAYALHGIDTASVVDAALGLLGR